ncbi:MAG: tyrosine-type recombinase/integrase [Chloroflexi bacterium]|nr:tyrosine-type recombinase/integrase [Chloroflexota bacterium]
MKADPKEGKRQAEKLKRELLALRDAAVNPSAQTLGDYLEAWIVSMRDAKRSRIRPRTLDHYRLIVDRHIKPALGSIRLDRLTERHIQAWIDGDGGSPRTIDHHRAVLRRALNVAVRQRVLLRNPALAIDLPPIVEFRGDPLSLDEASRLLEASVGDRLGVLWRLAIDTGFRLSELLGLGWEDDVDLPAGTVTPNRQLVRRRGQWGYGPPKVARELLGVAIAADTVAALRAHKVRQADEREADWKYWGLVFISPDRNRDGDRGMPYHEAAVLRAFHAACDAAGIRRRRIHDLRGTTATLMRELGVAEDVRMSRLGHTTKAMARHYGQAGSALDRRAADTLGEALRTAN